MARSGNHSPSKTSGISPAAQRHFYPIIESLRKDIKDKDNTVTELNASLHEVKVTSERRILELEEQNRQLGEWVERLLEYTELSKEDIKLACEKDKSLAKTFKSFNQLMSMTSMFKGY